MGKRSLSAASANQPQQMNDTSASNRQRDVLIKLNPSGEPRSEDSGEAKDGKRRGGQNLISW
jgi:hypothetical protein